MLIFHLHEKLIEFNVVYVNFNNRIKYRLKNKTKLNTLLVLYMLVLIYLFIVGGHWGGERGIFVLTLD